MNLAELGELLDNFNAEQLTQLLFGNENKEYVGFDCDFAAAHSVAVFGTKHQRQQERIKFSMPLFIDALSDDNHAAPLYSSHSTVTQTKNA